MDFLKRNIQKTLRNGDQIITKVTAVSSIGSGNSTLTGNYLPATANEDGTYTVDLTKVTFNGHIVATGEVSAYGAGSGTTPSGGSITVIDNLTSTDANAALSANQGRALKELIDNIDISGLDLSGYYNKTEIDNLLSGHTSNTTVHITETERTNWNDANSKKHTHTNKTVLDNLTQSVIDNSHTHSNKSVLDGITSTKVSNWDSAATNKHTHSNKSVLDGITATKVSNWDTVYSNWNTAFYFDNSGNLRAKVNVIGEQEISAYGEGESGGSGLVTVVDNLTSTSTDAALSANMGRYLKSLIDNIDISELDLSGFYSKSEVDTLLNGKANTSHTHTFSQISDRTTYIYDASASRTANTVLAAPNGSNGKATFRALVAADIPSLAISKITNLQTTLDAKAAASDLTSHTGNTTVHITSAERTKWNNAATNSHTHSNKSVLDGITAAKVTAWDTVVSNWNTAFTIDSNNNLKVKLNLIGEKEVSAYGAGSSSGSGAITIVDALTSSATDAALSANQGRVLKSMIDNIDISALDTSNFVTLNTAQTISALKTFTGGIVSSWLTVRHTNDTSQCRGLGWQNTSGSTVASINYHNTAQNIIINPIGATDVWTDEVGKYSLFVGNNKLTYNTYPILTSNNYKDYIKYWDTTISRTANTVLAAPSGSNGTASFRKLNASDLLTGEGSADFTDGTELLSSYANDSGFASTAAVNNIYRRKASSMWNYIKSKITADTSLTVALANGLAYKTLNGDAVDSTAGTFAFGGNSYPTWSGTDYAGLQVSGLNDKFQIAANNGHLVFRQNDSGGTNTSWNAWATVIDTTNASTLFTDLSKDSNRKLSITIGGTTKTLEYYPNSIQAYTHNRIEGTTSPLKWYKIFTVTIGARYSYGSANFMITDLGRPTSGDSRQSHIVCHYQQQNAFGSKPFVNLYILDGNCGTQYLKGVYTLNSDSTTIDIYTCASYSYMRPAITNICTYVSNGTWNYPIGGVVDAPTFNIDSEYQTQMQEQNFNSTVYSKFMYFRNNANNDNAGYVGAGSTANNNIALMAYSGNNLLLGGGGTTMLTLDGTTVSSTKEIETTYGGNGTFIGGVSHAALSCNYTGNYCAILNAPTKNGRISLSTYKNSNDYLYFGYASNDQISAGTNSFNKKMIWNASTGALIMEGNLTMDGANTSSSTSNTTQIVFRAAGTQQVALSCNTNALIVNPNNTDTTGQAVIGVNGHATYFTSSGNFGIGTSSPSNKLHVNGGGRFENTIAVYGSNHSVRIVGNQISSTNTNYYDYGLHMGSGHINRGFYQWSPTSKWLLYFDANNTIMNQGNVGIGTTSPSQKLHVSGNILATGEITAYSDIRLKKNIKQLQVRGELKPVTYEKDGKKSIGFIAQDVQKIYPELVTEEKTDEKYLSLNYAQLTAVLYAEILELKREIRELKKKVK